MLEGYGVGIAVLGVMLGTILGAAFMSSKDTKSRGCDGCPNYNHCRAHLGCSNNPNYRKENNSRDPR